VIILKKLHITIQDRLYYPITIGVSAFCWVFVIVNTLFILWL
jgi:carbon-monoxide dehydrogenase iron sulfur subunit